MAKAVNFKNKVLEGGDHAITCDWGYYSDGKTWHKGVDLVTGHNTEDYVVAIEDGYVVACANNVSGTNSSTGTLGMGNYVIVQHANGWRTRYQHMKYGSVCVRKKQTVKAGQRLGIIGNTGYSRGRHLHFDISNSARQSNCYVSGNRYFVDPKPFLYGKRTIGSDASVSNSVKTSNNESAAKNIGNYLVTSDVNVRSGPGTGYSKVSYAKMTENAREQIKKIKGCAVSYFPKGMTVTITQVKNDWGQCPSGWICLNLAKQISE